MLRGVNVKAKFRREEQEDSPKARPLCAQAWSIRMNVENLLKKSFKRFTSIENGAIIKIKKKRQKKNAAVSEKGEVKLKKPRRRKIYKVKSPEFVDTDNEDSVEEEEPVNTEEKA